MAYRRFLPANALANLLWGPVMVGVGYLFGIQAARLEGPWRWGGIAATAALFGLAFLRLRAIGQELTGSAGPPPVLAKPAADSAVARSRRPSPEGSGDRELRDARRVAAGAAATLAPVPASRPSRLKYARLSELDPGARSSVQAPTPTRPDPVTSRA
jgi:hypothetical protein